MNQIELEKLIQKVIGMTIGEFKLQNMLKLNQKNAFQKTEQLLYNHNAFKDVIKEKEAMIDDLRAYGLPKKSKSITSYVGGEGMRDEKLPEEQIDEYIETIQNSIRLTRRCVETIDDALNAIVSDPYYDIIVMKYFDGKKLEDIADVFEKDVSTISRNRTRLVNQIKIKIFPDESINEMLH